MNDDVVSAALKSLPREQAGLGFTAGVRRRIEDAPPQIFPAGWATRGIGLAMAAMMLLALGFSWRDWRQRQTTQHMQVLLVEKQALEVELEALRQLTAEARPVVYLGSDENVDLVLDLARFRRQGGFGSKLPAARLPASGERPLPGPRVQPASLHGEHIRPLRVVY